MGDRCLRRVGRRYLIETLLLFRFDVPCKQLWRACATAGAAVDYFIVCARHGAISGAPTRGARYGPRPSRHGNKANAMPSKTSRSAFNTRLTRRQGESGNNAALAFDIGNGPSAQRDRSATDWRVRGNITMRSVAGSRGVLGLYGGPLPPLAASFPGRAFVTHDGTTALWPKRCRGRQFSPISR